MTEPDNENDQADVEQLADALLAAAEDSATSDPGELVAEVWRNAAFAMRRLGIDFMRRYNRLEVSVEPVTLRGPVLSWPTMASAASST
jgi:hypothetical protein